jgi:phasin family protein
MVDRKAKDRGQKAKATAAYQPRSAAATVPPVLPVKAEETSVQPVSPPFVNEPAVEAIAATSVTMATDTATAAIVAAGAEIEAAQISHIHIEEGSNTMITQANEAMNAGNEAINAGQEATKNAAAQVQATFGEMNDRAKSAMEKNSKIVQEMTDLTKGNVEAIVASSRVAASGIEAMSRDAADFSRRSFEEASTTLKSFAEVRSPADLFRLQGEYARSAFDSMVAQSSKLSENMIKLAGEVAEPITNRYTAAAERVRTLAA